MNVSLKWLSRYVETGDKTPREVLDDLTMSTCEVEGVEQYGDGLDEIVVGHVVEREKHPDADKLSLTRVDVGAGELLQIVCGAPNVAAGQRVAVVRPGSTLPGGFKIKKSKIRGVESFGMICSEKELGLSDESDGILELDPAAAVGTKLTEGVDLLDWVFEIDNKSINHRPDLWGHYGLARELAAIWRRPLKPLCDLVRFPESGRTLEVQIEDLAACPRYTGLVIEGVRPIQSPEWMKWLLQSVGQRSIDLLVDLTNFVLFDLGQPMHAFDLRQLDASGVGVRFARAGEAMTTLDEIDRQLTDRDLLITSGDEPVALAGIMGGARSAVADDTTELFLESANFHAATVRRTSTRLGLRTESSARFEKSLDPGQAELGTHRFVGLLLETCPGAAVAGPLVDPSNWAFEPRSIALRKERLDLKLGHTIGDERVTEILESLAFDLRPADDGFEVGIPSFRATKDITIEDDLIEEVGRMFRYDNIPERPLVSAVEVPPRNPEIHLARRVLHLGAAEIGCHEVYNYSFVADAVLTAARADGDEYAHVDNPVAPEIARMRRHVLPSLLASLQRNLEINQDVEFRLMEEGRGYHPETRDEHGLPFEVHEIAFAWTRREGAQPYGELRERLVTILDRIGHPGTLHDVIEGGPGWVHPGRTVAIGREDRTIGYVGTVHPEVARAMKLPESTAIATLDLRAILRCAPDDQRFTRISPYPTQPVDVALLVDRGTRVADIATFLTDCGRKLVQSVELFEVYTGEGIPADRKSLNFTVTLGAKDRTLSAKDEEKDLNTVRAKCGEVDAELRG